MISPPFYMNIGGRRLRFCFTKLPTRHLRCVKWETARLPLSLKTSHCDVFASLCSAQSPSNPPSFFHEKTEYVIRTLFFGGRRWIRTTEAKRNRFTVCPLWPLGNSPICKAASWSWWTDLNPRPADYKSAALPTELHQQINFSA